MFARFSIFCVFTGCIFSKYFCFSVFFLFSRCYFFKVFLLRRIFLGCNAAVTSLDFFVFFAALPPRHCRQQRHCRQLQRHCRHAALPPVRMQRHCRHAACTHCSGIAASMRQCRQHALVAALPPASTHMQRHCRHSVYK
jgi:hypothetical protein